MKRYVGAVLLIVSIPASAGGDAVLGKVTSFTGENGGYAFRFEQSAQTPELVAGCPAMDVVVEYARVPWYSWLPWISTAHPTFQQTEAAAEYLNKAKDKGEAIYFGYMGGGLIPTGQTCHFQSKGLRLYEGGLWQVLSFHDYV